MSSFTQVLANRLNAEFSTGPRTPEGKAKSAGNAITLGLFSLSDFVQPDEQGEYEAHCLALWDELNTTTPLQRTFAAEIVKAAWRLRRCSLVENRFKSENDPMQNEAIARVQTSVDRARAQAHNIMRRSLVELRRLQAAPITPSSVSAAPEITNQTQPPPPTSAPEQRTSDATPRNAACPCGSGSKFKRCCGTHAPAVLGTTGKPPVHPSTRIHGLDLL